ncbi:MAG: YeeE/YedE family protein [Candidatus Marinimicrobia bacterium]|nr:YeeE/YedE family protein [Candidatus Neomarinimicrobiota bacterium]MCF7829284.1 YeeE/YedE family protein [Candidatus Neomarinimicrobiota bacterium]MCF7880054.1 YeeE/YedE family protein [Candidatus Neomarinimicrobiota bacterium]
MDWIIEQMRKKTWSPYAAGVFFGLVNVLALIMISKPLGASSAFGKLVGLGLSGVFPKAVDIMYFKFVAPPAVNFTVIILLGVVIGGFISSKMSGDFRWRTVTDEQWIDMFGPAIWKKWVVAFLGGIILEFSAGLAGGCTSGLAISGTMQLAPSGLIFIGGLFTTGILTSLLIYGKKW